MLQINNTMCLDDALGMSKLSYAVAEFGDSRTLHIRKEPAPGSEVRQVALGGFLHAGIDLVPPSRWASIDTIHPSWSEEVTSLLTKTVWVPVKPISPLEALARESE